MNSFSALRALAVLFTATLALVPLRSQQLHIHYDVHADSLHFIRDGKPVPEASVRRGGQVVLHVENYNNYLYDLKVAVKDAPPTVTDRRDGAKGEAVLPFLDLLLKPGGGLGSLSAFNQFAGGAFGFGKGELALSAAEEKEVRELETALNKALKSMQQLERSLDATEEELREELQAMELQAFAATEIQRLPYDPGLAPATIRRLAAEYARALFGESDPAAITVEKIRERQSVRQELDRMMQRYADDVRAYRSWQGQLEDLEESVRTRVPGQLAEFRADAGRMATGAKDRLRGLEDNLKALEASRKAEVALSTEKLMNLRTRYVSLMENGFSSTTTQSAGSSDLYFELSLVGLDSLKRSGSRERRLPTIPVRVYGGMQISSSVGLGIHGFLDPSQSFFVQGGTVRASDRESIVPHIGSYLHFFFPGQGQVAWGGTIGAGIPLAASEGLRNPALFLGPSVLFGQNSRIVLNAGLLGGQAERLGQGLKVGDAFPSDPSLLPVERSFRLGWYVGLSFNLVRG